MHDLLIVGAGYTGQRLAIASIKEGAHVTITSRDPATLHRMERANARALCFDLLEHPASQLAAHIGPRTWIVYSAPTLFREHDATASPPRHVRPVRDILDVASAQGAAGFIYLSSTSVYGDHAGGVVTERSVRRPSSGLGKMRRDIEDHVLAREGELARLCVARVVGIYGPGRTLKEYIERGRYRVVDGGQKLTNRIHVDDLVSALLAMIHASSPGTHVYNVCDGDPQAVADMVALVRELTQVPPPKTTTLEQLRRERGEDVAARWQNSYTCENEKLTRELGWQPAHANALQGYRAIFTSDDA